MRVREAGQKDVRVRHVRDEREGWFTFVFRVIVLGLHVFIVRKL